MKAGSADFEEVESEWKIWLENVSPKLTLAGNDRFKLGNVHITKAELLEWLALSKYNSILGIDKNIYFVCHDENRGFEIRGRDYRTLLKTGLHIIAHNAERVHIIMDEKRIYPPKTSVYDKLKEKPFIKVKESEELKMVSKVTNALETGPRFRCLDGGRYIVNNAEVSAAELLELVVRSEYGTLLSEDGKELRIGLHDGRGFLYDSFSYEEEADNGFLRVEGAKKTMKELYEAGADLDETKVYDKTGLSPFVERTLDSEIIVKNESGEKTDEVGLMAAILQDNPAMVKAFMNELYDRIPPSMRDEGKSKLENVQAYMEFMK